MNNYRVIIEIIIEGKWLVELIYNYNNVSYEKAYELSQNEELPKGYKEWSFEIISILKIIERDCDLDVNNYKSYCISADIDFKLQASLDNFLEWTEDALEDLIID